MNKDAIIKDFKDRFFIESVEAEKIIEKAILGGEIENEDYLSDWYNNRFVPNCVTIDENGYAKMCVDALKILNSTAATDYGGSRQRDMGQLWADMTRGYLGELAFKLFLNKYWYLDAEIGHEIGTLEEYLPMDIHTVKSVKDASARTPKIKISIKSTKFNGIWFDIPGDQFNHSDIHALVKVGTGRDHLFAFFKSLSVFKDKVLKKGVDVGSISTEQSEELYNKLPTFKPILGYICGFVDKNTEYPPLSYKGKKGRTNYNITAWGGPIRNGDLALVKEREGVTGKIKFEGIGEFSHDNGYLFNAGSLKWTKDDWDKVVESI